MFKLGFILIVFMTLSVLSQDFKPNAKVTFDDTKIYLDYNDFGKGSKVVNEGSLIRVSGSHTEGWHKVIFLYNGKEQKGYIKKADFDLVGNLSVGQSSTKMEEEKEKLSCPEPKKCPEVNCEFKDKFVLNTTPDNEREISDIMYLPQKDVVFAGLGLIYANSKTYYDYHLQSVTQDLAERRTEIYATNYVAGFGLTPRLALQASGYFYLSDASKYSYKEASALNNQTKKYKSDGLSDPSFSAKYRVYEQGWDEVNLDLIGTLKPSLILAKSPSESKKGTEGTGRHEIGVNADIGKKFTSFSLMASLGINYKLKGEYEDYETGLKYEMDGGHELTFGLMYQYKVSDFFQIDLGLEYEGTTESGTKNKSSKAVTIYSSYVTTKSIIAFNLQPIQDTLLIKVYYLRTEADDVKYYNKGSSVTYLAETCEHQVGLNIGFQF